MEYKGTYNKPNDQFENDYWITDAYASNALRYALTDLWTVNPPLADTSSLPNFQPRAQNQQEQIAVIDEKVSPQLQVTQDGLSRFLSLSTKLPLKNKRKMLYFPMDFGEFEIDGLIDTCASSGAIPADDLRKTRLLASHIFLKESIPPEIQIMVANGQFEANIAAEELQFEIGDVTFRKNSQP